MISDVLNDKLCIIIIGKKINKNICARKKYSMNKSKRCIENYETQYLQLKIV